MTGKSRSVIDLLYSTIISTLPAMIRKFFIFLLYCLSALCITGVFLVVFLPRERISGWAAAAISSRMPGYECSIDDIRYVHPLKIRLYQVTLENEFQGIRIPIDTLLFSIPTAFPIEKVTISGVVFGGSISGDILLGNLGGSGKVDIRNLEVSHIHLADIAMIKEGIDRKLQGLLSFSGRASLKPERLDTLRMTGHLQVRNFTAPLRRPIFSQTDMSFDSLTADVSLSSGVLQFTGGKGVGPMMSADFTGTVKSAALWRNRPLDFKGNVELQPDVVKSDPTLAEGLVSSNSRDKTRSIPYHLSGTLLNPEISFSGASALEGAAID